MVIATGFFDGVHLGHRFVVSQLVEAARSRGDESMVITFWPHPRTVLQDDARSLRLLSTLEEKKRLLKGMGVDHVEVISFTKEFSRLSTEEYLKQYIIDKFGGKAMLLGYDNRMGRDSGTPDEIEKIASGLGLEVIRTKPVSADSGNVISSTRIREALSEGRVDDAEAMLGYSYGLHGVVVTGNQLGRTIGFPTANMQMYEPLKLIPGKGVYLVRVHTLGEHWWGMCNIGCRPTVGQGQALTVETNIFGFSEDIYGLDITLEFKKKIRDERRFASLQELGNQLGEDRETCLSLIH